MPVPESKAKTNRFDPYKNFKFRVKWDGKYVAGVSKVSGLARTTQGVTHPPGGDASTPRRPPRPSPGQSGHGAITLERGVTHDADFEAWANKGWSYSNSLKGDSAGSNQVGSLKDFRKDIILDTFNEADQLISSHKIYRCWVSEYQAMPDLDANSNVVAIELIKLENEGWDLTTA